MGTWVARLSVTRRDPLGPPTPLPHPQSCIDWNREVLKRELGLTERDIVDIPQLFFLRGAYAEAFFPDMVRAWPEDRSFPVSGAWRGPGGGGQLGSRAPGQCPCGQI